MKKLKTKKLKLKPKKLFFKSIFFFMILIVSFSVSLNYFLKEEKIKNKDYVDFLLNNSYNKKTNYKFILNEGLKLIGNITLSDKDSLLDQKIKNTKVKEEKEVMSEEKEYKIEDYDKITSYISNVTENKKNPILYIYNTHQLETYSNKGIEATTINPNVMMASYLLKDKMQSLGINTVVEDTNMAEFIKNTGVTHNQFYGSSRIFMKNAIKKYPSLKYYIDIHRDSIDKNISTINIDNKNYARVLFVLGTSNKSYTENEKVMNEISNKINNKYPKLSRGIFKRYVDDWPEAYNQDLSKNSMLIEVGSKDNTMEEVVNTIDALSIILCEYIKENK